MRANDENDLGFFDADDDRTQNVMHLDSIRWEAGNRGGDGSPPCLTGPLEEVRVQVGIMTVPGPGGGSSEQVAWVRCP